MTRKEETYYNNSRNSVKTRTKRKNTIVDYVVFGITVIVMAVLILSWAARWINPQTYGPMAAIGLLMPILFTANFVCLLYWVIRWKRVAFAPLTLFVLFFWGISMFFRPALTQSYTDHSLSRSLVNVMSYNVRGMMEEVDHEQGRFVSNMNNIISVADSLKPGILCIQEFQSTRSYSRSYFGEKLPGLPYQSAKYVIGGNEDLGWGLAIYSRYPIIKTGHLNFHGTSNSIMWADVGINHDTVRIFNAHLQTTSISASDQDYIVNMGFVTDSTRSNQIRKVVSKLKHNFIIRAGQADTLAINIAASPHPVIVCGDFNDTPVSYTYRKINKGLKDSFREVGKGYGYSYRGFFNLLRIDYILHSKQIECLEYYSPKFDYSDHNPVAARMKINNSRKQ